MVSGRTKPTAATVTVKGLGCVAKEKVFNYIFLRETFTSLFIVSKPGLSTAVSTIYPVLKSVGVLFSNDDFWIHRANGVTINVRRQQKIFILDNKVTTRISSFQAFLH